MGVQRNVSKISLVAKIQGVAYF